MQLGWVVTRSFVTTQFFRTGLLRYDSAQCVEELHIISHRCPGTEGGGGIEGLS